MFRSTGIFNELMCPDSRCSRAYCSFWHDPAQVAGPSQAPPSSTQADVPVNAVQTDLYNPYCQQFPSFSGYSASLAQPSNIPCYSIDSTYNGYIASTETNKYTPDFDSNSHSSSLFSSEASPSSLAYTEETNNEKGTYKIRIKSEPVDEDDITELDSISEKEPHETPTLSNPENPGNLLECAKTISEIDAEIERLKELRAKHKQKATELRGPIRIRGDLKNRQKEERPITEYVPKKIKSEKPCKITGYTPTPLAELERKKAEKRKVEGANIGKECKTEEIGPVKVDRRSSSEISQEYLFGEDDPVPSKKSRLEEPYKVCSKREELLEIVAARRNSSADDAKNPRLTEAQIAAAKQRVARPGAGTRPNVTNRKVASAVEQLHARMEAVAKERNICEKDGPSTKKPQTLEQQFGEKRVAKDVRLSKNSQPSSSSKPMLHEPTSTKVPMSIRLRYLDSLYKEFLNFLSSKDAKTQVGEYGYQKQKNKAEIEEKSVLDKVKHKQGYTVAIVNALKRIRDISEGKNGIDEISHDQLLLGKGAGKCTVNANGPKQSVKMNEDKLYTVLEANYLLTKEQLRANSFPVWESKNKVHVEPSFYDRKQCKKTFVADFDMTRVCVRCTKEFQLNMKGKIVRDSCVYHLKSKSRIPGKIRNTESRYPCCGGDDTMEGCQIGIAHVCDTLRESELLKFVSTPPPKGDDDMRSRKIFALDCEMVYTVWGPAIARLTVVDFDGKAVLDEIIKPAFVVIDYNTTFSGITASHLETATNNLDTALLKFFKLVNSETILIGHSLESDLKAMRVVHSRVVDTSVLFPHRIDNQKKRGLRELCLDKLGKSIQDDIDGHDSKEDSLAALELVIYKVKYDGKLK